MKKLIFIYIVASLMVIISGCTNNEEMTIDNGKVVASGIIDIGEDELLIHLSKSRIPLYDGIDIPFPRLAMWWLEAYEESAEAIAKYDLLLNEFDDPYLSDKLSEVRQINDQQILLRPISPSEHYLYTYDLDKEGNPAIAELPTSFFLMHQGAKLVGSIDKKDTKIKVSRMIDEEGNPLFYEGDDIAIGDSESATIIKVDERKRILTVKRGHIRAANSHNSGEIIQAHVRFWPESWVMNITAACPKETIKGIDEPVDYITYFHLLSQNKVSGLYDDVEDNPYYIAQEQVAYDGFVIDRFEDHQSWLKWVDEEKRDLDPYLNQTIISDEAFDELVMQTVDHYTTLLKETYGDEMIIIRNNSTTTRFEQHDGQVYESFGWDQPTFVWWDGLFIGGEGSDYIFDTYDMLTYLEWFELKERAIIFMEVYDDESGADSDGDGTYINPLEQPNFEINEQKMRFSLTSTLLGNGFYSYEVNTNGHGTLGLMWFDAYDRGMNQKGYLGYPIDIYKEVKEGVYIREYEKGLVVVNVTDQRIYPKFDVEVSTVSGFADISENGIGAYDGCILLLE